MAVSRCVPLGASRRSPGGGRIIRLGVDIGRAGQDAQKQGGEFQCVEGIRTGCWEVESHKPNIISKPKNSRPFLTDKGVGVLFGVPPSAGTLQSNHEWARIKAIKNKGQKSCQRKAKSLEALLSKPTKPMSPSAGHFKTITWLTILPACQRRSSGLKVANRRKISTR